MAYRLEHQSLDKRIVQVSLCIGFDITKTFSNHVVSLHVCLNILTDDSEKLICSSAKLYFNIKNRLKKKRQLYFTIKQMGICAFLFFHLLFIFFQCILLIDFFSFS